MVEDGADLLDIGGESTRPGAQPTSERRGAPPRAAGHRALAARVQRADLGRYLQGLDGRRGAAAGASIVNDISGLRYEPDLADGRRPARRRRSC